MGLEGDSWLSFRPAAPNGADGLHFVSSAQFWTEVHSMKGKASPACSLRMDMTSLSQLSVSVCGLSGLAILQCIARDVDGKREVAGVHWDYDCYGAPGKIAQVTQPTDLHTATSPQSSSLLLLLLLYPKACCIGPESCTPPKPCPPALFGFSGKV